MRLSAAQALTAEGVDPLAAVAGLHEALHDSAHADVRASMALIIGTMGAKRARSLIPSLVEALEDPDAQVRAMAVASLGMLSPSHSRSFGRVRTGSDRSGVRSELDRTSWTASSARASEIACNRPAGAARQICSRSHRVGRGACAADPWSQRAYGTREMRSFANPMLIAQTRFPILPPVPARCRIVTGESVLRCAASTQPGTFAGRIRYNRSAIPYIADMTRVLRLLILLVITTGFLPQLAVGGESCVGVGRSGSVAAFMTGMPDMPGMPASDEDAGDSCPASTDSLPCSATGPCLATYTIVTSVPHIVAAAVPAGPSAIKILSFASRTIPPEPPPPKG